MPGGPGGSRCRGGARGRQPGTGVLGAVSRQRSLYRPAGPDLDRSLRLVRQPARFSDRATRRQSLGPGGDGVRDVVGHALLLQFPQGRPRQLHRHRAVRFGQDGRAQLPGCPGAEIQAAHRPVRQGPRRRNLRPCDRRPLRHPASGGTDRLQSAATGRQCRQPGLPARLDRPVAVAARPAAQFRGRGDHHRGGRRQFRAGRALSPPALFPRASGRGAPADAWRPGGASQSVGRRGRTRVAVRQRGRRTRHGAADARLRHDPAAQ